MSQKNIILTGSKDNVVPYLQAMDIYVLPSLTETTSISTLEAMSCGLPVVVTPVGYVKNYIHDGKNGLFFPKKNSGILARKINELIKDIQRNPHSGIGKPEPLKYDLAGLWSRRIDREHRLVYQVNDNEVLIYSCKYHYDK